MEGTLLVAAGTAVCCFLGWLESRSHQKNLERIPIRIHVNGTRGKSGVARLIAAGLRAGGVRTFAKTTGTLARAIFPDGTEYPIFRPARANVIEQVRMVRLAAQQQVDALVIECMALQPALQSLCELKFVQSTHGVITNARADHLDVMGPTAFDVAQALSATVPVKGKLFTAEQNHLSAFRTAAADRQSELVAIEDDDVANVTWDDLDPFPYVEHAENVALALRVCAEFGIDRATALAGMWEANPDPGVMKLLHLSEGRRRMAFVNGFAANDPDSTGKIWHMMLDRHRDHGKRIAVVNCRTDRPDRSVQLAEASASWRRPDHMFLIGEGTDLFARTAAGRGVDRSCLTPMEGKSAAETLAEIWRRSGDSAVVMGMGNTAGPGLELVDYVQQRTSHAPARHVRPHSIRSLQEAA